METGTKAEENNHGGSRIPGDGVDVIPHHGHAKNGAEDLGSIQHSRDFKSALTSIICLRGFMLTEILVSYREKY